MARSARLLAIATFLLAGLSARANDRVTFSAGSLIIPMQSHYQSDCGTASAYGLVWRILQSNQAGHYNASHPVTVYWAIKDTKGSPNRCVPNNLMDNPGHGAWDSNTAWNDGCDVTIQNSDHQPVVPVSYSAAFPTANNGIYGYGAIPMFDAPTWRSAPSYGVVTLNEATDPRFTTIQYLGGPFIIAKKDVENVMAFLKNGDSYTPVGTGSTGPLSRFTTPCSCSEFNADYGGHDARCNYVNLHQATISFDAYVARRMNTVPPKIALLAGADNPSLATTETWGGGYRIYTTILDQYLKNAGLWVSGTGNHTDSGGCPEGSFSACSLNGSDATTKYPGLIYDAFWANADLITVNGYPHGLLNASDPSDPTDQTPLYRVFWTPHWESFNTNNGSRYTGPTIFPVASSELANALDNIAYFADRPRTGLMAECASLESYESSLNHTSGNISTPTNSTHFQFSNGLEANGIQPNELSADWPGKNCSDPDYNHTGPCMFYPNPGSPFAQTGDFVFSGMLGHVQQYRPNYSAHSTKNPGMTELAISWDSAAGSTDYLTEVPGLNEGWDFFSVSQKDGDPNKAMILYLAGHDYGGSISGNRIVLNTLLNLGANPSGRERALAPPVGFNDPNDLVGSKPRPKILQGTFVAVADYPDGVKEFSPGNGAQWVFPYIPGHLRAHPLEGTGSLTTGANEFDFGTLWDADAPNLMPVPLNRNLFTYFGGTIGAVDSTSSFGSFGVTTQHPVLQTGWKAQSIRWSDLQLGTCVDELKYGLSGPTGHQTFGLVAGSDNICDLQQALEFTPVNESDTEAARQANLAADFTNVRRMIQRVRGFCWSSNPNQATQMEPGDGDCDPGTISVAGGRINRAHLGGIVRSTPVIVGAASFEGAVGRPTVAYFGGYDGQLHAVYVSGGAGYTGITGDAFSPNGNQNASEVFTTPLTNLPHPGTELWAFIPASQLPLLRTNAARLDAPPMVEDVFVDLEGTGARSWRTILVMSVGGPGREIFAMDVTNPLKPVLLWDLVGSIPAIGPRFSATQLANKALADSDGMLLDASGSPTTVGTRYSNKWVSGTTHYDYLTADRSDLFDYSDLGGASGVTLGQLRRGLDPLYVAFVHTNASGANATTRAVELFAIDIASGQKVWQWERPYSPSSTADNAVPPVASVYSYAADVPRLYVPDQEGRLWELDANTGRNVNYYDESTVHVPTCSSPPCELALLDTSSAATPQPLTTNVAVVRIPGTVEAESVFDGFAGERLLVVGTAGADWVSASVAGQLHALLLDEHRRKPIFQTGVHLNGTEWTQSAALESAKETGLLQEPTGFPHSLSAGQHLYGSVTAAGQRILFESAAPGVSLNDPMQLVQLEGSVAGATYAINEASATTSSLTTSIFSGKANFGGTAVLVGTDAVYTIAAEVNDIAVQKVTIPPSGAPPAEAPSAGMSPGERFPHRLTNWLRRTFLQ